MSDRRPLTTESPARTSRDVVGAGRHIMVGDDGELRIEGHSARALADRYGTPLYVTSETQIRANARRLRQAFEDRWERVTLLYATKANFNLAVRQILAQEGMGGDCFGLGELSVSLRSGVSPEKLVMNGSSKQDDELRAAIEAGVTINVDAPSELDAVVRIAEELRRPANIFLRVLPFSYPTPSSLLRTSPRSRETAATTNGAWTARRSSSSSRARSSPRACDCAAFTSM